MSWTDALPDLSPAAMARLSALPRLDLAKGAVLFRAGDAAQGFLVVVSGRVDVFLTGPGGREILLYAVEPGQSCVQTTLGLLAEEPYSGEAVATGPCEAVLIPRPLFARLMEDEAGFRQFVLQALGRRMTDVTRLLERVAFARVAARLASALLELVRDGEVHATQAELATHIGSAREVVSRQLEQFSRSGWVATERGRVLIRAPENLRQLASEIV